MKMVLFLCTILAVMLASLGGLFLLNKLSAHEPQAVACGPQTPNIEFFDKLNGKPKVFYSRDSHTQRITCYDAPGYDPRSGQPLVAVRGSGIIDEILKQGPSPTPCPSASPTPEPSHVHATNYPPKASPSFEDKDLAEGPCCKDP
jgi:hypothetical protein